MNKKLLNILIFTCSLIAVSSDTYSMEQSSTGEIHLQIDCTKPADACLICTEPFTSNSDAYSLPSNLQLRPKTPLYLTTACGHTYHTNCILNWIVESTGRIDKNKGCPICRNVPAMQTLYNTYVSQTPLKWISNHRKRIIKAALASAFICETTGYFYMQQNNLPDAKMNDVMAVSFWEIYYALWFLTGSLLTASYCT